MNNVILIGAEDALRAARTFQSAADNLSSTVADFTRAIEKFERCSIEIRESVERLEALQYERERNHQGS